MKNFFFDFNFEKSRENGRFLFKTIEKTEVNSEQLAKIEALQNSQKARLPLAVSAETHQELGKLSPKKANKKAVEKTSQGAKESTKKSFETDNKFGNKKEVESILKEFSEKFAEENKIPQKFEEEVLRNKKYQSPEEFAKTSREFMEKYSDSYLKYVEKSATEHPYLASHFHLIPNDLENTGKISTALFSLGFISNQGGMKDSLMRGGRWALWGAVLTHPVVTGALAHSLKWAVPKVTKIVGTGLGAFVDFIYNPGKTSREFYDRLKKGGNPFVKDGVERTSEMLKTTTNPLELRKQGMQFSTDLNVILDGINRLDKAKSSEEKEKILEKIRPQAVQFLAQTENLAKGISQQDVVEMGRKIWENDPKNPPQDSDYRLVLMMKSREIIKKQFKTDENFNNEVAHKLQSVKNNLSGADKNKLKELGVEDLKDVIAKEGENFAKITAEKKHGIRRALSNMSGTALLTYIFLFFLTKGVMGVSHLFQKGWEKTKDTREKLKEKPFTTIVQGMWFPFKKVGQGMKYLLTRPFKWLKRKAILNVGKDRFQWTDEQIKAYKSLSKKEKNKVVDALKKIVEGKKKHSFDEMEKLRKKYKKDRKWWKLFMAGTDKKGLKNDEKYDEIKKAVEEAKKGILKSDNFLKKSEWQEAFKYIKSSNEKVYKVLFPSD